MKVIRIYLGENESTKWHMLLSYLRGLGVKYEVDEDKK